MDSEQGFKHNEFEVIDPSNSLQILISKTHILEATGLNVDKFISKLPFQVRQQKPAKGTKGISFISFGENPTKDIAHFMVEIGTDTQEAIIELGESAEQKSVTHEFIHLLHCAVNPRLLGIWKEFHQIEEQLNELKLKGQTPLDDCLKVADPERFMETDTARHLELAGLETPTNKDSDKEKAESLISTLSEAHLFSMQAEIYKFLINSQDPTEIVQEQLFQEVADDLYDGDTTFGFNRAPGGVGYFLRGKMERMLEGNFKATLITLETIVQKFGLKVNSGFEFSQKVTDLVLDGDPEAEFFDYETAKERVSRFIEASASYSELEEVRSMFGDDPDKLWERIGDDFDRRDMRAAKDKLIEKVMSLDEKMSRDRLGAVVRNMLEAKDKISARKSILTTHLLIDADLPDDPIAREAMLGNAEYIGELINLVLSEKNSPLTYLGLSPQEFLDDPEEIINLMQSQVGQLDDVDISRLTSLANKLEGEYFGWGSDNMIADVNRERIRSSLNGNSEKDGGLYPNTAELESRRDALSTEAKLMVEPIAHVITSFIYGEPPLDYLAEGLGRVYSKAFSFKEIDIEKHIREIYKLLEKRNPEMLLNFLKQPTFAQQVEFLKKGSSKRSFL